MKGRKQLSRGATLFSAICWTITTVLWTITITVKVSGQYYSGLLLLQIAVLLLSLLNAVINWRRWAAYDKNQQTNEIVGG